MVWEGGSRARRWCARVALIGLSVVASLLVAELAFRAFGMFLTHPRTYVGQYVDSPSPNFASDPKLGWRMPRRTPASPRRRGRARRALRRGRERLPRRSRVAGRRSELEASRRRRGLVHVRHRSGRPPRRSLRCSRDLLGGWKVTNVAQPGYAVDQIWQTVVREAIPRAPDLVVAGIYPEDLERSLSAYRLHMNKPTFLLKSGAPRRDDRGGPSRRARALPRRALATSSRWRARRP